mgnify:FL=1
MIVKKAKSYDGSDLYICYSENIGGPISTGKTKEEAIEKYEEMKQVLNIVNMFE